MSFTQIELFTNSFWNWLIDLYNTFNFPLITFGSLTPPICFLDIILAFSFFALLLKFTLFRH